ncbi:MAG: DUF899 domain-containing protein [Pseudomonadota bacterium]
MTDHEVVDADSWLKARRALLRDEKAFTRLKDYLAEQRRALPWLRIEKDYRFTGPDGEVSLGDLFGGRRQLIVNHFMFGPDWARGCEGCTEVADNYNGVLPYLHSRDASFVAISRGPLEKLEAFKAHMGWTFPWVSSAASDFNFDFDVSFRQPEKSLKQFNFETVEAAMEETHGVSVFIREGNDIFLTYRCHERGVDILQASMQYLDLLPLGRQDDRWAEDDFRRR